MIHELRIYTAKAGTAGEMAKNSGTIARDIRGDTYGKLEGYWMTEIGPLNQVVHLWSYADLNERARLRAELGKNERWGKEYLPLIRPILVRQDIRLLNPVVGINKPDTTGNISWAAHVGGFLAGMVMILFLRKPGVGLFDRDMEVIIPDPTSEVPDDAHVGEIKKTSVPEAGRKTSTKWGRQG